MKADNGLCTKTSEGKAHKVFLLPREQPQRELIYRHRNNKGMKIQGQSLDSHTQNNGFKPRDSYLDSHTQNNGFEPRDPYFDWSLKTSVPGVSFFSANWLALIFVNIIISSKPEISNLSGMKNVTSGNWIYMWKLIFITLQFLGQLFLKVSIITKVW